VTGIKSSVIRCGLSLCAGCGVSLSVVGCRLWLSVIVPPCAQVFGSARRTGVWVVGCRFRPRRQGVRCEVVVVSVVVVVPPRRTGVGPPSCALWSSGQVSVDELDVLETEQ